VTNIQLADPEGGDLTVGDLRDGSNGRRAKPAFPSLPVKRLGGRGLQLLTNGDAVDTSHHSKGYEVKRLEVARDKKRVWVHLDLIRPGIHHSQVLDTNRRAMEGRPLRRVSSAPAGSGFGSAVFRPEKGWPSRIAGTAFEPGYARLDPVLNRRSRSAAMFPAFLRDEANHQDGHLNS
jgi:hypothetical protein